MDPATFQTVLASLIIAALLWLARSVNEYGNQLTQLKTILTGADGSNGLNGKVKALEVRTDQHEREIGEAKGRHALLEQRVDQIA